MTRAGCVLLLVVAALTGCAGAGPARTFDDEPAQLQRRSAPLLLVHGLLVTGRRPLPGTTTFDHAIVAGLTRAGFDVWLPALAAAAPPEVRAAYLRRAIEQVLARTGATAVHLIAHSQGGIDARVLLEDPVAAGHVLTLTTLSSPHGGTPLANIALELRGSLAESFMNRAARRIDESRGWPASEGQLRPTARALTPASMAAFNATHPLAPVPVFSLAASPAPARDGACDGGRWPAPTEHGSRQLLLAVGSQLLRDRLGPDESDDGFVPTRSQRFGIFLGCVPLDHGGWLHASRGGVDVVGLLVELAIGLRDVERSGDPHAMDAHVPRLATLARAR